MDQVSVAESVSINAICTRSAAVFATQPEYAHLNSEHFQSFLDGLSAALGDDIALIQLDQAFVTSSVGAAVVGESDSDFSTRS
jgi:hypothetical protein